MAQIDMSGGAWPALPYIGWQDTCTTLHMWTQIVGKIWPRSGADGESMVAGAALCHGDRANDIADALSIAQLPDRF
jgi:hypothetical protein